MNDNSHAIICLCSRLVETESLRPYETSEWTLLAQRLLYAKKTPGEMFSFNNADFIAMGYDNAESERIKKLLDRAGALSFEISKYINIGIKIVTRADKEYPRRLKNILKESCPPLFYYAGDIEIANDELIGFVGSRDIEEDDVKFTCKIVNNICNKNLSIVSGGAKGVDLTSTEEALMNKGAAVEFLSDSLLRRVKNNIANSAIRDGRLLCLSITKPDAGFNTGLAMARNKYIYALSKATVVIKSDYNQGGTWAGATEALRNNWVQVHCREKKSYKGNMELIKRGAIPVKNDDWDGTEIQEIKPKSYQSSIFDII